MAKRRNSRILDRTGRPFAFDVFEGATDSRLRRYSYIPSVYGQDLDAMISSMGWDRLLSVGRYLYANLAAVHCAINEIGTYAVGPGWTPRYMGRDKAWGEQAEAWLSEWFKRNNQRGPLYDFRTELFLTSVGIDRDGDRLMVRTYSQDGGWPMLLFIPTHQIGTRYHQPTIKDGRYKGLPVRRGVIFNKRGRAVAYNILGAATDGSQDWQVSARDSRLVFEPEWSEQARGITALANAIRDWTDFRDIRDFEKIGIKTASSVSLLEMNETGSANTDEDPYDTPAGNESGITHEDFDGGSIRYFKANSGAGLRAFESHRPSQQTSEFLFNGVLRNAFSGLQWPIEFAWDASKVGGAVARMIVAKAERKVSGRQARLSPLALDAIRYGIAHQIDNKLMAPDPDWYLWDIQLPRMLTVDAGYESEADIAEYQMGFTTLSEIYGRRGQDWREQIKQRIAERQYLVDETAGTGISPDEIVSGATAPAKSAPAPAPEPTK